MPAPLSNATPFARALLILGLVVGAVLAVAWIRANPPSAFEPPDYLASLDASAPGGIALGPLLYPGQCGLRAPGEAPNATDPQPAFAIFRGAAVCAQEGSGITTLELQGLQGRLTLRAGLDRAAWFVGQLAPVAIFLAGVLGTIAFGFVARRLMGWVREGS